MPRKCEKNLAKRANENASIDWTNKASVKDKLKVIVKRLLRQYSDPSGMQFRATGTVLKQAELIADELQEGTKTNV